MASHEGARQRKPGKSAVGTDSSDGQKGLSEDEATQKASRGWIRHFLIALVISLLLPIVILIVMPSPLKPVEITGMSPPPVLDGPLAKNNILTYAERIYKDKLSGPESIAVDGEHIYTGCADGWVYHLHKGEIQRLVQFGKEPCGGYDNENTCGRPLGMRMDKDGFLIVCDGYYGLFRVNVVTGDYTTLYKAVTPVNGKPSRLVNDLDIGPDGKIYFTDSSTKWHRNQFTNILFEGIGNGRLLMYNPENGKTVQLLDGILFANGVQLTKDKKAVLVSETGKCRILKYDLETKKSSVWADNLPGPPDNIRYSKMSGTYWVGLAYVRQAGTFSFMDFTAPRPWLRGQLGKIISVKEMLLIAKYLMKSDPKAMAVELDEHGTIIGSMQDRKGEVISGVSEVETVDGVHYLGSYHANFLGRLYKQRVPKS